jgi:hypothetical protein
MKRMPSAVCGIRWSLVALLLTSLNLHAGPTTSDSTSHFKAVPTMEGTAEQSNVRIREWLLEGYGNVLADLQRLADDKALNADAVARFHQKIAKDETIGAPLGTAITNAQGTIKNMEALLTNPQMSNDAKTNTLMNLDYLKRQVDLLLLNQEKFAVARKQLTDLGKTCDYWRQFWNVTIQAAGIEETRRQLKSIIELERARLQTWITGTQELGAQPLVPPAGERRPGQ